MTGVQTCALPISQLRSELGTLSDRSADELRAAAAELRDGERVAADATERLVAADAELAGHAARVATATVAASGAALDLERAATLAMSATAEADRLAESMVANRIVPDEVEARLGAVEGLRALGDELGAAFEQVQRSTATASERERQLAAALETSGMPDVELAQAMLLDADLEARYRQRYTEWNDEMVTRTAMLEQLRQQGVPERRPDTATLAAGASAAAAEAVGARSGFTTVADAAQRASSSLDAAESMLGQSADLRQQRDTARRVFDTCNGKGKVVGLERWVLGHELGRVVAAASVHLAVMSNHRYRLDRAAGLELEVFDSHTGRARSTASLSGGEQFQASLSLALGLADVVSHGGSASGKQFEALFVDEGFGSLDHEALSQAIDALEQIQEGGRMVGAITHVEEMKQRLHQGIVVRRRADGSGSTLTVNP